MIVLSDHQDISRAQVLVLPWHPAPPDYTPRKVEITASEATAEFEAIAEDATREEDDRERTATEEDLYAATE